MGKLFGADRELPYEERKQALYAKGVAVWDVLRECYREGSLDSDIEVESEEPNDFVTFLESHPEIHSIFFNGQKSETAFRRHALKQVESLGREFQYALLPSTSPAHAGRNFAEKLAAWRVVARAAKKE
jgi:hypoxanthine-DNA glycosylase